MDKPENVLPGKKFLTIAVIMPLDVAIHERDACWESGMQTAVRIVVRDY
jgi:hypothetical protein